MDEPICYLRWAKKSLLKKPALRLDDKLHNALILDDKDEFLKLINDPGFEPMQRYHRSQSMFHRDVNLTHILQHDALQIALAVINGETKGIINDVDLVFKDGWTPLHLASATPNPNLIKFLIQRGDPVDVPCDYEPLALKQATPLYLALEVIDYGFSKGYQYTHFLRFNTVKKPWTPLCSIFELLFYVCNCQESCLEVIRLLLQKTENKEPVRKAFIDYADEGKFVKLAALFLAAPELFLSSSLGGDGLSSIDALYVKLNSLDMKTDIQDGLSLLLDVFELVGHMLIANLRVASRFEIDFFLREAAQMKLGIKSRDDYLLRFFKPVTDDYEPPSVMFHTTSYSCLYRFFKPVTNVYEPPPYLSKVYPRITNSWHILPLEMSKQMDIDIDYVNRMLPPLNPRIAANRRRAIKNKLSTMPNICTLFEKMAKGKGNNGVPEQWAASKQHYFACESDYAELVNETTVPPPKRSRKNTRTVVESLESALEGFVGESTFEEGEPSNIGDKSKSIPTNSVGDATDDSVIVIAKNTKTVGGYGSPNPLYKLNGLLSPEQKRCVEDIGFGGLLELKAKAFHYGMMDVLMKHYDSTSRVLHISEKTSFVLSKHDVYDVFMLPCPDDKAVDTISTRKLHNPDYPLVVKWSSKFGVEVGSEVSLDKVLKLMLPMTNGGDEFKRLYVLYAMGTFLAPTSHQRVDFCLVKAVEDVESIVKQDWCSYILDTLSDSITRWKPKKTETKFQSYAGGCLMLLQLLYFHRLCWRGVAAPSTIPLVQHWTYKSIKYRVEAECEAANKNRGLFGLGEWDKKTYPVSRHLKKRLYRVISEGDDEEQDTVSFTFKKSDGFLTDEQIIAKYKEKGENPRFSSPSARSIKHMEARSFCTEATNAKCRLNFKLNPGNGWKIRVIYPTKLKSFSSVVRLSHIPMIAKHLIK